MLAEEKNKTEKPEKIEIAVLDIETTAKNPKNGVVIEIGVCLMNLITGKISKLFDSIVIHPDYDPVKFKNAWIFENSDLNPEDVCEKGQYLTNVIIELQEIFSTYRVVAFNQGFDLNWLEQDGFRFKKRLPDPMFVSQYILNIRNPYGYSEPKWPSVVECLEFFKIDEIEKHRAYSDCVQEAKIIFKLFKMGKFKVN